MIDSYEVYFDRNQLVKAFCKLYMKTGGVVGWKEDGKDIDYVIMFADLPTGQVSWHIPRTEIDLGQWPEYKGQWDWHTTEQKRVRICSYLLGLG